MRRTLFCLLHHVAQEPLFFTLPFFGLLGCTFVVLFFALCETNFSLDSALGKMQIQRHECVARPLYLADEFGNFRSMQKQLSATNGVGLNMGRGGGQR